MRASIGYRILLRFKAFSLEDEADYLSISGTNTFDPIVSYTGQVLPPDIESPDNVLYIRFETDASIGDTGFLVVVSQTQALGK